ncbi:MAG: SGNH hydrolase domain-containing protein, partial [Sphingomonas sp.]
IDIIDPALRLCDAQSCRVTQGGYPIYYDSNHLSARGALFVAPIFGPMMQSLVAPPPQETGRPGVSMGDGSMRSGPMKEGRREGGPKDHAILVRGHAG